MIQDGTCGQQPLTQFAEILLLLFGVLLNSCQYLASLRKLPLQGVYVYLQTLALFACLLSLSGNLLKLLLCDRQFFLQLLKLLLLCLDFIQDFILIFLQGREIQCLDYVDSLLW